MMLTQYTTGEVNHIVSSFAHLRNSSTFKVAMEILESRYWDSEVIAATYVARALEWLHISAKNPKALDSYALFLREINSTILDLDKVRVLEYSKNIKRLVSQLPVKFREKWRQLVYRMKKDKKPVRFVNLLNLVEAEAQKTNYPTFGNDAMNTVFQEGKRNSYSKDHSTRSY